MGKKRRTRRLKRAPKEYLLFAYGTLNHSVIQERVWGTARTGKPDRLVNHILLVADHLFFAQAEVGHEVPGYVYKLTHKELKNTDQYEGRFYVRRLLPLTSGGSAYAYVAREPREYTSSQ